MVCAFATLARVIGVVRGTVIGPIAGMVCAVIAATAAVVVLVMVRAVIRAAPGQNELLCRGGGDCLFCVGIANGGAGRHCKTDCRNESGGNEKFADRHDSLLWVDRRSADARRPNG